MIGAAELIGEIGVDMTRFPTAAHLVSWAKFAPAVHESAGKTKKQRTRPKGNPWLAATLGQRRRRSPRHGPSWAPATGASPDAEARARPSSRIGNSILTIVWHLLSDPDAQLPRPRARPLRHPDQPRTPRPNLATALEAVTGQKIIIRDGKAVIIDPAA